MIYQFQVRAANMAGVGLPSSPSDKFKCEEWTIAVPGRSTNVPHQSIYNVEAESESKNQGRCGLENTGAGNQSMRTGWQKSGRLVCSLIEISCRPWCLNVFRRKIDKTWPLKWTTEGLSKISVEIPPVIPFKSQASQRI